MKRYPLAIVLLCCLYESCVAQRHGNTLAKRGGKNIFTEEQLRLASEKCAPFPDSTELAIAVIENGITRYLGIRKVNDALDTVTNRAILFEIGSITKVFTSTLLAGLVTEGRIALDDNINSYLTFPLKDPQPITFRELANHTSGLPRLPTNMNLLLLNSETPYAGYNEDKLKEYLTTRMELNRKPTYAYSNLGAGLLGYTLTVVESMSYQDLLRKRIFSKYGMITTTADHNKITGTLVPGRNPSGKKVSNWDLAVLSPAGGILSNTEDLARFAIAQFDPADNVLALTRTKTASVRENMDIGLGWHIMTRDGHTMIWHNGGTGGYTSSMIVEPVSRNGVIVLSNVSAFHRSMTNIDALCFELMKTLHR